MKKFTKAMSLTLISTVMLTSLVGCGQSGSSTAQSTSKSKQNVVITYMDWESADMNSKMSDSMKDFETKNPSITVKQIPTPIANFGLKLNQMIAANDAPDIFESGHDMALQMAVKGTSYDFTKYAANDKSFVNGFYPGVYNLWVEDGKLVGLPGLLNVYGIFYNKDDFKKAGIADPKIGWSWNDLFADAQKLSSKSNGVQTNGLYNLSNDPFGVGLISVSNGGQPFADQIQRPTIVNADATFKATIKTIQGYIKNGSIAPPSYNEGNINSAFMQGKVPMMEFGQWEADDLIRNAPKGFNWGFAPSPKGSSMQSVTFDNVGWASPKSIKNPDAVWKVMKYMDTTMYEKVLPETPVAPPAYMASAQPYYDKLKAAGHQDLSDGIDYLLKTTNKQPIRFNTVWAGDATKFIGTDWNNILEGKADISTTVDKMVTSINKVIAANK